MSLRYCRLVSASILFPRFPKVLIDLRSLEVEVISAQWTMNQLVRILGFVLRFTDLLDCGHKGTNTVNNDCHNVVFMQHSTRRPTCAKKISSSALDHQQPRATRQEESTCSQCSCQIVKATADSLAHQTRKKSSNVADRCDTLLL